jgi:3-methyladenine DNA glycosylase AlkC
LKLLYSPAFIRTLAADVATVSPGFDPDGFVRAVLGRGWRDLELKRRVRRIATTLAATVPGNYRVQLVVLRRIAANYRGFTGTLFPDFVEVCGLDDFDASMRALAHFTRYSSSEFAVRPFIVREEERTLRVMRGWAEHHNEHVRRLASEGCRPRLPWGVALQRFKVDPTPILPILERLRADPSDYVRRSVANNLNDICKDHPDLIIELATRWIGESAATDALVKHACRTLLKRGDQRVLRLFGQHDDVPVTVELTLTSKTIAIGHRLAFDCVVRADADTSARIEYVIDFVTKTGGVSRKVFKIGDRQLSAGAPLRLQRQHRFTDFTTRKHYVGMHRIGIVVNGVQRAQRKFDVVAVTSR